MIISIIVLLLVTLALWGIYVLVGKSINGPPLSVVGVILILIWLAVVFWVFRGGTIVDMPRAIR